MRPTTTTTTTTTPSTNPPPRRRALHERTPSETNEPSSAPSMRLVHDHHDDDAMDNKDNFYSSTPFPTKPEHVLPPNPGVGQEYLPHPTDDGGEASGLSTGNLLNESSQTLDVSFMDHSISDPWDLSSTIDVHNTPSQGWEDDPESSRSSFPDPVLPGRDDDRKPNWDSEGSHSDDGMVVALPAGASTIKPVVSETPSRQSPPPRPANPAPSSSSPNVAPIGLPSSPNFVALDNSSMNVVQIGPSSNPDTGRSNSLASFNSFGTVVRNYNAARWIHSSSPERSNSHSRSFHSSPPYQSVASVRSASTRPSRERSHSQSATSSSPSEPNSDIQAIIESGIFVQYPTVRAPSSSSSWVDTSQSTYPEFSSQDLSSSRSYDRFASHLSTVPSHWSGEGEGRVLSPVDESYDHSTGEPSQPSAAVVRQKPASSIWLVTESDNDEHLDNITDLLSRSTNSGLPSLSSGSRHSSLRRPGTSSSFILNAIPAWAKAYYRSDGRALNPPLSLIDGSRPSSARSRTSNSNAFGPAPMTLSRPPPRIQAMCKDTRQHTPVDLRDPRSHWVDGPESEEPTPPPTPPNLPPSWSPHLYPDRVILRNTNSIWTAPSLDSTAEPILGRRNVQVYAFCFGFVCPISESALHVRPVHHVVF